MATQNPLCAAKLMNFHTLHWPLQMRFRTTSLHFAPRTPRLMWQVCDSMACSFLSFGFVWSSWHTEFALSFCLCELSGTIFKPCLVAFLELSSCPCVDEPRPHRSSHVFNQFRMSSTFLPLESPSSPSGCPNCRELCHAAARSRASRSSRIPSVSSGRLGAAAASGAARGRFGASALPTSSSTCATAA